MKMEKATVVKGGEWTDARCVSALGSHERPVRWVFCLKRRKAVKSTASL